MSVKVDELLNLLTEIQDKIRTLAQTQKELVQEHYLNYLYADSQDEQKSSEILKLEVFEFFNQIQSLRDKYQLLSTYLPKQAEDAENRLTSDLAILPPANNTLQIYHAEQVELLQGFAQQNGVQ